MRDHLTWLLAGVLVVGTVSSGVAQEHRPRLEVGHHDIDGRRLRPFESRWTTVAIRDGERKKGGILAERLEASTLEGREVWRRIQWREMGERRIETTITFDRKTLAPISLEHTKEGSFPDQVIRRLSVRYGPDGATGEQTLVSGETSSITPMPMGARAFETDVMGLVLATLPLRADYQAELPSVYWQMGEQYYIRPRVTGTQDFQDANGRVVTAWKVEVEWLNLRTQDIYEAGDMGSGGTYYVVTDPPPGFPFVPRYVNENTDIVVTFDEAKPRSG